MVQGPTAELPEGAEAASQEFQEAVQAADKEALRQILDKAASDPAWKEQLIDDPDSALAAIGVGEAEVEGQARWPTKWVYRWTWWGGWGWYHYRRR